MVNYLTRSKRLHFHAGVYLGAHDSVPLAYISVFIPVSYCFDCYRSIMGFEIRKCDISGLFFSKILYIALVSPLLPIRVQDEALLP